MRVQFLKDYGNDPDVDDEPRPLYEKGEIVSLFDDFAERLITEGVVIKR